MYRHLSALRKRFKFAIYFKQILNPSFSYLSVSCPTESLKVKKTFSAYMEEHANLRSVCEEGKGKLQWERDIPQDDLGNYYRFLKGVFSKPSGKMIVSPNLCFLS